MRCKGTDHVGAEEASHFRPNPPSILLVHGPEEPLPSPARRTLCQAALRLPGGPAWLEILGFDQVVAVDEVERTSGGRCSDRQGNHASGGSCMYHANAESNPSGPRISRCDSGRAVNPALVEADKQQRAGGCAHETHPKTGADEGRRAHPTAGNSTQQTACTEGKVASTPMHATFEGAYGHERRTPAFDLVVAYAVVSAHGREGAALHARS